MTSAGNWLTSREMDAWRAYIEVQGDLINAIERDLATRGLTLGDYQVLVYLSEAEEQSMRMCDLADILQLSPSGLTRRLDRLVADGYVSRQSSPADRRVMMGSLTATGREAARADRSPPCGQCSSPGLRSPRRRSSCGHGVNLHVDCQRSGRQRKQTSSTAAPTDAADHPLTIALRLVASAP